MKRTIILSNRLPLKIEINNDRVKTTESAGGLATGLKSFHRKGDSKWIGWPGLAVDDIPLHLKTQVDHAVLARDCIPVSLSYQEISGFYDGFCNHTLWPMFHYFLEYTGFEMWQWEAYKSVNLKYAKKVLEHYREGDVIWIHDYQLLLVPNLIRQKKPDASIGFFLHIPFPSFEIFRLLPWREEILIGMLGADLIGFHTFDYEQHFLNTVNRVLNRQIRLNRIDSTNRQTKTGVFPMGIDYRGFEKAAIEHASRKETEKTSFQEKLESFKSKAGKLILSIDRLDYSKGIANRLRAFEYFLEKYPDYQGKVSMVMLSVPSRTKVPRYRQHKKEIDELVGRINGKFSRVGHAPIWYFYRSMPFDNLVDLYASCEIAFIMPFRDGMNLVAKEYIASRIDQTGVLVLSEMAGAANELGEALKVNPNNFEQIADVLKMALEMPVEEQKKRNKASQKTLRQGNVEKWAENFLESLNDLKQKPSQKPTKQLNKRLKRKILEDYKSAKKRIFFLDYDGTLVNFQTNPKKATPDQALLNLIKILGQKKNTDIVLISGREKADLGKWWKDIPIGIVCEHGLWMRKQNEEQWQMTENARKDWKKIIKKVLETFTLRAPGSFMEEKEYSLAWHYRKADPYLGKSLANDLEAVLTDLISNQGLSVLRGDKVLEVKNSNINKGKAAVKILGQKKYDFILALGDDWTDEQLFQAMPSRAFTIKVGNASTQARFRMEFDEVRKFLQDFTKIQLNGQKVEFEKEVL